MSVEITQGYNGVHLFVNNVCTNKNTEPLEPTYIYIYIYIYIYTTQKKLRLKNICAYKYKLTS